jgi:Icc-related predicted phosphoesterase
MSRFGRRRGGERTRLFFATDVHGSERCFRKWLNAAAAYRAGALILGGDVTGKLIVPVVGNGDGRWHAEIFGERVETDSEASLAELRKRIRMMGRYDVLVSAEGERDLGENPEALSAAFRAVTTDSLERWTALAAERLGDAGVPVYMMLGNDDEPDLAEVLRASSFVDYAEDHICELPGGWQMLSFGPSTPTPWHTPREMDEPGIAVELERLAGQVSDFSRTIFNVHCPPADTHLDQAPELDDNLRPVVDASGMRTTSVGSTAVREAIERHQPPLGLHGHVHESPGASKLGQAVCLNPGSEYADGILRGAIVELDTERGLRSWQLVQG